MSFPETWKEGLRISPFDPNVESPDDVKTFRAECDGCGGTILEEFTDTLNWWYLWSRYVDHLKRSHIKY